MSYFNHAFQKAFIATDGFYTTPGAYYAGINGDIGNTFKFTFVDPKTWEVPDLVPATTVACPLVLVSSSIHPNDKIGPFHGGYSETVKSKTINPKYINRFYRVDPCTPQNAQITVGAVNGIVPGTESDPIYEVPTCTKEFLCDENYYLRVDIKGSPVLRTLSRNTYYEAQAYTGCCAADALAPTAVNPLIVYSQWAYNLLNSPLISPFINIQITYSTDGGTTWLQLAPSAAYVDNGVSVPAGASTSLEDLLPYTIDPSSLPGDATTLAGLIINGGYIDTRFQTCTFYPNDSIIAYVEPVKVYASEVDLNGDPCVFSGLCVNEICLPVQGTGYGENVLRSLILTEGYAQQPFYTGMDLRIREITNGTDVFNAVDKNAQYTRYYIQHSVPRFNNPTGTFDNDQYLLEIVTETQDAAFEAFMAAWLANANSGCSGLEEFECYSECTPVEAVTPVV